MIPLGNEVWGFMLQTPQCKPCFNITFNRSDYIRTCLLRLSAVTQGQESQTKRQYTDTGPTSPGTVPIMPDVLAGKYAKLPVLDVT